MSTLWCPKGQLVFSLLVLALLFYLSLLLLFFFPFAFILFAILAFTIAFVFKNHLRISRRVRRRQVVHVLEAPRTPLPRL